MVDTITDEFASLKYTRRYNKVTEPCKHSTVVRTRKSYRKIKTSVIEFRNEDRPYYQEMFVVVLHGGKRKRNVGL